MIGVVTNDDIEMLKLPIKLKVKRAPSFTRVENGPTRQKFTKALIQVKNTSTHKLVNILLK